MRRNTLLWLSWFLATLWFVSFGWTTLAAETHSGIAAAGIAFLTLIILVAVHASLVVGWRSALAFFSIMCLTSFALESISIATGFPFGFFVHHTDIGPKPFGVPFVVPVGYAVFGWLAWAQTRLIVSAFSNDTNLTRFATPLLGAFVLAGYDYPYDPIGATVLKIHSYLEPTGLFGVPLSNFLGWHVTGWVAFQFFAFFQVRFITVAEPKRKGLDVLPSLIWIVMAGSYWVRYCIAPGGIVTEDGRTFVITDIYEAAAAISLPSMVFPALLALVAFRARSRCQSAPDFD
ncbi:carotenoid biosynthesis protein [Vogesella indigofera]|uniref:carotenoid biosynthesis protein n=1 Tax=Vogesella indigofera TaxID=45465 RepID=UPI00234EA174|nr:carotenoid biosynthesis protein [Vogesella indigofera]MDC7701666.1 carotenoid biosynthesis protein [Vogesella indigofera]